MVEQKLSVRDEDLRKGNSEEADTVVARYSPKAPNSSRVSSSLKLSISLLYCGVQIILGHLLLLFTLTLFIPPSAYA